jgi:branched-subunit amino acid aminotransferase/4-amino-4-deoxychorismate lyase
MEGLSSNFFAIVDGAMWTAADGILKGTVRGVMISVCEAAGIPVVLQPPNVADIERWEGCLIASTSRLALPVHDVQVVGAEGVMKSHTFGGGGVAARIDALVLDAIEAASEEIGTE